MSDTWAIDPADADAALVRLRDAKTVLMPTHQNVDADGLSSPLAMRMALAAYGVEAYPVITDGDFPSNLRFLPDVESVLVYGKDDLPEYDVLCLIDCADRRRLGNFAKDDPSRLDGRVPIINIDHHITNDRFGVVNIVEPEASSSAEIVAEILKLWNTEVTPEIARALSSTAVALVAMITRSTSPSDAASSEATSGACSVDLPLTRSPSALSRAAWSARRVSTRPRTIAPRWPANRLPMAPAPTTHTDSMGFMLGPP